MSIGETQMKYWNTHFLYFLYTRNHLIRLIHTHTHTHTQRRLRRYHRKEKKEKKRKTGSIKKKVPQNLLYHFADKPFAHKSS
jgi:hypothetical protein